VGKRQEEHKVTEFLPFHHVHVYSQAAQVFQEKQAARCQGTQGKATPQRENAFLDFLPDKKNRVAALELSTSRKQGLTDIQERPHASPFSNRTSLLHQTGGIHVSITQLLLLGTRKHEF
jgi:hypothetical protein